MTADLPGMLAWSGATATIEGRLSAHRWTSGEVLSVGNREADEQRGVVG
jgi:hypothetical protein